MKTAYKNLVTLHKAMGAYLADLADRRYEGKCYFLSWSRNLTHSSSFSADSGGYSQGGILAGASLPRLHRRWWSGFQGQQYYFSAFLVKKA